MMFRTIGRSKLGRKDIYFSYGRVRFRLLSEPGTRSSLLGGRLNFDGGPSWCQRLRRYAQFDSTVVPHW